MVGMYIIKGGKRAISKHDHKEGELLLRQGKGKTPAQVMKDLDAAIQKLKKPGIKVVVPSGSRTARPLPTKEANALIKRGEAQAASTVLTQLKKAVKQTQTKKAGGGPLKGSKQIMNPRPIKKPKGVGAATKGYGRGYK
jgi:hypothetical protein